MRRYIFILSVLVGSFMGMYAMSLREAYDALSNLPDVLAVANDTVHVSVNRNVENNGIMQVAMAHNLNREKIKANGDATFTILNQVPLSYMINGGCNGYVAAFVYCTTNEFGASDMLIVTMSGEQGDVTYMYLTGLDENSKSSIQEARLTMQGSSLSIIPRQSGLIGAIKVNCR